MDGKVVNGLIKTTLSKSKGGERRREMVHWLVECTVGGKLKIREEESTKGGRKVVHRVVEIQRELEFDEGVREMVNRSI